MGEEEQDELFDDQIDIFDWAEEEKANIEIYVTRIDHQLAFIQPDGHEFWLNPEDSIKLFILLGKALKSLNQLKDLKVTLEYNIT